jgi:hypothetical protein
MILVLRELRGNAIIWLVKLLQNPRGFTLTNSQKYALIEAEKALNVAFPLSSRNTRIMLITQSWDYGLCTVT